MELENAWASFGKIRSFARFGKVYYSLFMRRIPCLMIVLDVFRKDTIFSIEFYNLLWWNSCFTQDPRSESCHDSWRSKKKGSNFGWRRKDLGFWTLINSMNSVERLQKAFFRRSHSKDIGILKLARNKSFGSIWELQLRWAKVQPASENAGYLMHRSVFANIASKSAERERRKQSCQRFIKP